MGQQYQTGVKPYTHFHKVRLAAKEKAYNMFEGTPYEQYADKLAVRAFFDALKKKRPRKLKEKPEVEIRYTLFLEPVPYLCLYTDGDEDLVEFKPIFFDSFREARSTFRQLLDVWYKSWMKIRKASDLHERTDL